MTPGKGRFLSDEDKKLILVAEDEQINREILTVMLSPEFEVVCAQDGAEALKVCREVHERLSLVLLDLMMPVMSGLEVLSAMKEDPLLKDIPVIVVTADHSAEVESLSRGAVDFIPKPYPDAEVIAARIHRVIELYEDREIISGTERDPLTGLYNRDYFYRYAEQFDHHHPEVSMDAIVIDVNHFHMINERFGSAYGDHVLRSIGEKAREAVAGLGGIVCRREADTFLVYCPTGINYQELLESAAEGMRGDDTVGGRVRLRIGVYPHVDKTLSIEQRFDRAKMASDSVQRNLVKPVAVYDDKLHEQALFAEQLIDDFRQAIDERQFKVYYQPKYSIASDPPVLNSAEALVRWDHPVYGIIQPTVFIPLFEENGLIEELDIYVWKEAAGKLSEWKKRFGSVIPVSVNVSRVDLYDPNLVSIVQGILKENGLSYEDLSLEITESAYTRDSEQIVKMVSRLRKLGVLIAMDDFGTGYSSLNMLSSLPIDVLKLDLSLVQNALDEGGDTRMQEVIMDIAGHLDLPVIAEGVETEKQISSLRRLGCNMAQGFYFSKPVESGAFEEFLAECSGEKDRDKADEAKAGAGQIAADVDITGREETDDSKVEQERMSFFERALLNEEKEDPLGGGGSRFDGEITGDEKGLKLRTMGMFFMLIALAAAVAMLVTNIILVGGYQKMVTANDRFITAREAARDMETASDYLTDNARSFVVTGEAEYMENYFREVKETRRRDQALSDLEGLLEGNGHSAYDSLAEAMEFSVALTGDEYLAMRLAAEANGYGASELPEELAGLDVPPEDQSLAPAEKTKKATELVFGNAYTDAKDRIREKVGLCTQELLLSSSARREQATSGMRRLVNLQTLFAVIMVVIAAAVSEMINRLVRRPLMQMVDRMSSKKEISVSGVQELRFVARIYNRILKENQIARQKLSKEAAHDKLTGLFNRGAYEMMLKSVDQNHMALILVDVDYFKEVNDTYGHDMGDRVLRRVADILRRSFRSVDIVCRIGGDEFVVIMTRADSSMRDLVKSKINRANELLQNPADDLPPVSLSVGVAFADRKNARGDIFKDADTALYRVKEAGRCGCEVF